MPSLKTLLAYACLIFAAPFAVHAGAFEDGMKADNLRDYEEAAIFYTQAAAQGHAKAQYRLGILYINGQGVMQSDERAAESFGQAAEQGLADAQYALGVLYQKGRGVEKSNQRAAALLRVAADQNHPRAQYALAFHYFYGQGVLQSKEVAVIWLKKAAALGDYAAGSKLKQLGIQ
jgi:TPR repeat protein